MQSSIRIEDGTGTEVLTQLNDAFQTVASNFTGSSEPKETYAGMVWLDTSGANPVKKQRNVDNTEWIVLGVFIDGKFFNEDRAIIDTFEIQLGPNWDGTTAPFTQEVSVPGLLESDNPQVGMILSGNYEIAKQQLKEFSSVFRGVTTNDKITFYTKQPTTLLATLQVKVTR